MSSNERHFDFDEVNPDAQEATKDSYPYFQWHHGKSDLEDLGKEDVRFTGGFIFSLAQKANKFGENFSLPGFKPVAIKLGRNKQDCLGATSARFAILRRRFCWMQKDERGREHYFSAKSTPYEKGMVGKMQVLAIPAGIPVEKSADYLFVLAAKATAQINLRTAMDAHAEFIVAVANKTAPAGKKLPHYAFYAHIGASKHVVKGDGSEASEVTQPMLYRPSEISHDYLFDLYIGKDRLITFQELYLSLEEWAHAWDTEAGLKGEFNAEITNDVWASDDDQVSEFIKLCATLKGLGEPMDRLNAIAQGFAGVSDMRKATPVQMAKAIGGFETELKRLQHEARMALQAPGTKPYDATTDEDIPF